ncbi:unnamed protein product, partial [Porites evermanni]
KVNGGWSGWSAWSGCAAGICAGNQRIRTRTCTNPIPSEDGAYCEGDNAEQLDCKIDGGYTEWSQWSLCENPCGGSVVNRSRTCANPSPTADGRTCSGDAFQTKLDCISPCPSKYVPALNHFSLWTRKLPKLAEGLNYTMICRRVCKCEPLLRFNPLNLAKIQRKLYSRCTSFVVNGGFSLWSAWTTCSKTCGTGTQSRSRTCTSPSPIHNGLNCTGDYTQAKSCKLSSCPGAIDGGFSKWSAWSACSEPKYCLQGVSRRTRTCTNPSPANGGDECAGLVVENKGCPT